VVAPAKLEEEGRSLSDLVMDTVRVGVRDHAGVPVSDDVKDLVCDVLLV
jgi:hypothetical protein